MAHKLSEKLISVQRCYRKLLLRKPLHVITENRITTSDVTVELQSQSIKQKPTIIDEQFKCGHMRISIPNYKRLGEKDGEFLKIISQLKSRKHREKTGRVLLEGKRLIIDAIDAGCKIESIFFSKKETLVGIPFEKIPDVKIMKVFHKKLSVWSDLTTCPGIMGVCKKPDYKSLLVNESTIPLTVICDNIRDPGNLGSILRCGAAVGCCRIILTKGCVDVWEPKVLRAASGAHFHISIISGLSWDILINYLPENADIFLADSSSDNEDKVVHKQIAAEPTDGQRFIEKQEETMLIDSSYEDKETLETYKKSHIPQYQYTEAKYRKESVLVIGGETEGISAQAIKLASEFNGCRIKIPTANNIESLNAAMSMAIIAYEIKRQIL